MTPAEYKTEQDTMKIKSLIKLFNEHFLPKKHLSQPRRILLEQTVRNPKTGRLLAEIDRHRKRMRVRRINNRKFAHLKIVFFALYLFCLCIYVVSLF